MDHYCHLYCVSKRCIDKCSVNAERCISDCERSAEVVSACRKECNIDGSDNFGDCRQMCDALHCAHKCSVLNLDPPVAGGEK